MRDTIKIAAAEAARPGITQRLGEFDTTATREPRATPSLIFKEASVVYGKDDERVGGALRLRGGVAEDLQDGLGLAAVPHEAARRRGGQRPDAVDGHGVAVQRGERGVDDELSPRELALAQRDTTIHELERQLAAGARGDPRLPKRRQVGADQSAGGAAEDEVGEPAGRDARVHVDPHRPAGPAPRLARHHPRQAGRALAALPNPPEPLAYRFY